jgi:hypothetical protein
MPLPTTMGAASDNRTTRSSIAGYRTSGVDRRTGCLPDQRPCAVGSTLPRPHAERNTEQRPAVGDGAPERRSGVLRHRAGYRLINASMIGPRSAAGRGRIW